MFSNLIVPLDGSPEAAEALQVARTLADLTAGRIVLLRVTDEPGTVEAQDYLAKVATELEPGGVSVSWVVERGDAATGIERAACAQHGDAIVMVTHGRSGVARRVLGSVAERLLTHGSVPLLLLRPGERPVGQLRNMLVPLDGSPGAAVALGTAVALARASGARLTLSQVVEPIPRYAYVENYVDPSWDEEARRASDVYLQGLAARLHRVGVHAEGHAVVAPHVAEQLSTEAERTDADLVIMSTHAHRGVARALLGSVADEVVRSAKRPVLLVHQHSRARLPVHNGTGASA